MTPCASRKPLSAALAPVPGLAMQMARTTSTGYMTTLVTSAPPQIGGRVSRLVALRLPACAMAAELEGAEGE
eukprot:CAMPEP_0175665798 /NCGR_PEP_ID=MMETSP0097-20121207/17247_1 /TAXON_ID=311494 /ORGANISM="Alexandrium monilatum, Strain CCMP3105" /LENGTH=71 /DNA_ID=CAMNT_0016972187 /DNA_START=28 /DNA_END=241 /DNA_ORIENTATION=-